MHYIFISLKFLIFYSVSRFSVVGPQISELLLGNHWLLTDIQRSDDSQSSFKHKVRKQYSWDQGSGNERLSQDNRYSRGRRIHRAIIMHKKGEFTYLPCALNKLVMLRTPEHFPNSEQTSQALFPDGEYFQPSSCSSKESEAKKIMLPPSSMASPFFPVC